MCSQEVLRLIQHQKFSGWFICLFSIAMQEHLERMICCIMRYVSFGLFAVCMDLNYLFFRYLKIAVLSRGTIFPYIDVPIDLW